MWRIEASGEVNRHQIFQRTQNICITFIQCWANVEDIGPALYKCYTNVLCLLGCWCRIPIDISVKAGDLTKFPASNGWEKAEHTCIGKTHVYRFFVIATICVLFRKPNIPVEFMCIKSYN